MLNSIEKKLTFCQKNVDKLVKKISYSDDMKHIDLSEWIKKVRLSLDKTQEQMAEAIHCSKSSISALECGRNDPSFTQIVTIYNLAPHISIPGLPVTQRIPNQNMAKIVAELQILDAKHELSDGETRTILEFIRMLSSVRSNAEEIRKAS